MLDFIKDIFASFRQASLERVKSPVLGAFVFSWLGFNWQMVAIAMFSDKSMESRIEYINQRFDIGDYLFAPICVTALICVILPQLNKAVTLIQGKPNADTVSLSLDAKIAIAEKQQRLAEADARKKLAEKKEERFIEQDIYQTKEINKSLSYSLDDLKAVNDNLESELQKSTFEIENLKGVINGKNKHIDTLHQGIEEKEEKIKNNDIEFLKIKTEIKDQIRQMDDMQKQLNNYLKELKDKDEIIGQLKNKESATKFTQGFLIKKYPGYFTRDDSALIESFNATDKLDDDYNSKYKLR